MGDFQRIPIIKNERGDGKYAVICPDNRERNPIPLNKCVGICCIFLMGTYKADDIGSFVACKWRNDKTVEENMELMRKGE